MPCLFGEPPADDGLTANKGGCVAVVAGRFYSALDGAWVVPVHLGHHLPAVCTEARRRVIGVPVLHFSVDGDAIVVVQDDQLAEPQGAGQRARLVGYTLHQATVADEHVGMVVDNGVLLTVELRGKHFLGDGHADRIREALTQRAGGRLDTGRVTVLRMSRGHGMQLAEIFDLLHGQRIARQVQQRVEKHRAVAVGQHEAIPVGPIRIAGIVAQEVVPQDLGEIGHAHGHAWMPGPGALNSVHAQRPDGIGKISTRWHATPRRARIASPGQPGSVC